MPPRRRHLSLHLNPEQVTVLRQVLSRLVEHDDALSYEEFGLEPEERRLLERLLHDLDQPLTVRQVRALIDAGLPPVEETP